MQLGFVHLSNFCTGCSACQVACKDLHDSPVGENRRRVATFDGGGFTKNGDGYDNNVFAYNLTVSCNHCSNPVCVKSCPTGAMTKRAEDGIVFVDSEVCVGCGACMQSCPYDAPQMQEGARRVVKCDFCMDLLAEGKNPVCVDACPLRALGCGDIEDLNKEYGAVGAISVMPDPSVTKPNLIVVPHKDAK